MRIDIQGDVIAALQFVRSMGVSSLIGPLSAWSLAQLEPRIVVDGSAFSTMVRQACASMGTAIMMFAITMETSAGAATFGFELGLGISGALAIVTAVLGIAKVYDDGDHAKAGAADGVARGPEEA